MSKKGKRSSFNGDGYEINLVAGSDLVGSRRSLKVATAKKRVSIPIAVKAWPLSEFPMKGSSKAEQQKCNKKRT